MTARRIVLRETRDGRELVFVPLAGGQYAQVDAADFDRLTACGLSAAWFIATDAHGGQHVRAPSQLPARHPVLDVARLITGAAPNQRVRFRDGDRLNLTRPNLKTEDRSKTAAVLRTTSTTKDE